MDRHTQIERGILGTMLAENYLIRDSGVQRNFFTSQIHQNIFHCMEELTAKQRPVDYVTILTMMPPAALGGANYVAELLHYKNPVKFDQYVTILLENWKERMKHLLLVRAKEENWTIDFIRRALDDLEKNGQGAAETAIQTELLKMGERPYEAVVQNPGVPTGLKELDEKMGGFQPAELTIIAARPSMGKTDTLNHFALQAGYAGYHPIIFSLEMSKKTMIDRLIAVTGGYNRLRMRDPYSFFTEAQKRNWLHTLARLDEANIQIDDRAGLKVAEIRATARKIIQTKPNLKPIIFIDYLQIIQGESTYQNRTEIVGQISSSLKQMAKEFDCPVVCLSQLNRGVEARQDKRPMMSDLRDSGNIEQDADVIIFLYRDDYYNEKSKEPNMLELNISKHRNGPTGTTVVRYMKNTGILSHIERPEEKEMIG